MKSYRAPKEVFSTHHAFLCVGDDALSREYLESMGISAKALGVDYKEIVESPLSIGTVRTIRSMLSVRPIKTRVYTAIYAHTLAHDAMHALLKMCEDPNGSSALVLITRDSESLLPTLRSRFVTVFQSQKIASPQVQKDATAFARASVKGRLDIVKKYIEEGRESALYFVDTLHEIFRPYHTTHPDSIRALVTARSYLTDTSSSTKQLLEYVAGVLPRT